uniref:Uncharacterized protein n=1 Tax=Ditylenchus dipsaci TaxID=166011 RepID=A0A915DI38_9BILA
MLEDSTTVYWKIISEKSEPTGGAFTIALAGMGLRILMRRSGLMETSSASTFQLLVKSSGWVETLPKIYVTVLSYTQSWKREVRKLRSTG